MASAMTRPFLIALLAQYGAAAVLSAPDATITPAPAILKRAITTIGYISTREYDGTTYWDTITANEQGNAIATSSNLFQICDPSKPCTFFSCSGDYVILSTSSLFCGGASSTCSFWELKTDVNDKNPLTNYWCDAKTSSGGIIYMTTPEAGAVTVKSSLKPVSVSFSSASNVKSASIGNADPGIGQDDGANIPSKTSSKKKSTPIGAIVGGVVGGIGVLAAIIFGVWFMLRRKRNQSASNNTVQQTPPAPPQNPQQPPAGVQYYHEQKPVPQPQVQQVPPQPYGHYDPNTQQAPAQPFYDPNAQPAYAQQSQAGYGAPPPEKTPVPLATGHQMHAYHGDNGPVSPVPQYSPSPTPAVPANVNELPSGRM